MAMSIEDGVRKMISEGESKLSVYWVEDIIKGDECWWIDACEDRLDEICESNWTWDVISKEDVENDDDTESEYGSLESDIIVDEPFSEAVIKSAIEMWLKDRDLKIIVEIISPDGTVASNRILNAMDEVSNEMTLTTTHSIEELQEEIGDN